MRAVIPGGHAPLADQAWRLTGTTVPGGSREFHPICPPSGDAQPGNAAITYRRTDTHRAKGLVMNLAERWLLGEGGERA